MSKVELENPATQPRVRRRGIPMAEIRAEHGEPPYLSWWEKIAVRFTPIYFFIGNRIEWLVNLFKRKHL